MDLFKNEKKNKYSMDAHNDELKYERIRLENIYNRI